MAKNRKKNCFIIMPITTPIYLLNKYKKDKEHFLHVLSHLFIPAVENIGYKPIPPKVKGAQIIQAEIIKKIQNADLVLCDMSALNPNVFFELGIRTALNKPVCLVKDDNTESIPFDTSIINTHTYKSSLNVWEVEEEIQKLQIHIDESLKTSLNTNTMWSKFGISMAATASLQEGEEGKLDLIYSKLNYLTQNIQQNKPSEVRRTSGIITASAEDSIVDAMSDIILSILMKHNIEPSAIQLSEDVDNQIDVFLEEKLPVGVEEQLTKLTKKFPFHVEYFFRSREHFV